MSTASNETHQIRKRFHNTLEGHILKLASKGPASGSIVSFPELFTPDEVEKSRLAPDLGDSSGRHVKSHANNLLVPSRYLPWFLQVSAPKWSDAQSSAGSSSATPAVTPDLPGNCLERRATPEHIAECNNLFAEEFPQYP